MTLIEVSTQRTNVAIIFILTLLIYCRFTRVECSPTWMRWSVKWTSSARELEDTRSRPTTCLGALSCSRTILIELSKYLKMLSTNCSSRVRRDRQNWRGLMLTLHALSSITSSAWLCSVVRVWALTSSRMTQYQSNSLATWLALTQRSEDISLRSANKPRLFLIRQWLPCD